MFGTRIKLVNQALSHLGEEPFDSLDVDPQPPKLRKILPHVDPSLAWVLRQHPWLSAMDYRTLGVSATLAGDWRYPYVYELPLGCIRLWTVDGCSRWERGVALDSGGAAKVVVRADTNAGLNVGFTTMVPVEALDPDLFRIVGYELAACAAGPIQNDYEKAVALRKVGLSLLPAAQGADGTEQGGQPPEIVSTLGLARRSAF